MTTLISAKAISSIREIWWDIRPHPNFGTVELRICDGLPTMTEIACVAALAQCLVEWMDSLIDRGYTLPCPKAWIVGQNKWRAARYGIDAEIIVDEPGGQHVNTSNTRAEVRFDIAGSASLGPRQRARLVERLGPEVRVVASDERSQLRNRELALERLRSRLAEALRVETPRRATKPTKAAKERRLEDKRHRSETKRRRQGRPGSDE